MSPNEAGTFLGTLEAEYKAASQQPLPGAYRTAKCVLRAALATGVALLDDDSTVIGRTAVERAIKDAKEGADAGDAPPGKRETLVSMLRTAISYAEKHGMDIADALRDAGYIV